MVSIFGEREGERKGRGESASMRKKRRKKIIEKLIHFFVEMTKKSVGPSTLQPDLRHQSISNAVNPPPILLTCYYIHCYLLIRHFNPARPGLPAQPEAWICAPGTNSSTTLSGSSRADKPCEGRLSISSKNFSTAEA